MSRTCAVRTIQHGPVLNIFISAMTTKRSGENNYETKTCNIDFKDLAVVNGNLKPINNSNDMELMVGLKRSEAAKHLTVSMVMSCEGIVKCSICQDEWAEVPIKTIHCVKTLGAGNYTAYLYSVVVEIEITTQAYVPVSIANQLYEETEFTDFKLLAADGAVAVHKSVLFVKSEMFRTMLKGQWKETGEGSINMEGVSLQTLQHLKDFMYLGIIPDEGLEQLLLVARRCLMDNLAAACIEKLITTAMPETFDGLAEFACQNNIIELVRAFAKIPEHVVKRMRW